MLYHICTCNIVLRAYDLFTCVCVCVCVKVFHLCYNNMVSVAGHYNYYVKIYDLFTRVCLCVKVFATELPIDGQSAVKLKVVKGRQMQVCTCAISLSLSLSLSFTPSLPSLSLSPSFPPSTPIHNYDYYARMQKSQDLGICMTDL